LANPNNKHQALLANIIKNCIVELVFIVAWKYKMQPFFSGLDWAVFATFVIFLLLMGYFFQRKSANSSEDYFLASHSIAPWLGAISTIATMQSAATFLGAPDFGFKGDFTYLGTNLGTIMAAFFVAMVLIPRFYAAKVTTVYELLKTRFSVVSMRAAGAMFLIGRVFAEGARIYLAAIAVSMMLFSGVSFQTIAISSFAIIFFSFLISFFGGLRSVIWTDFILFILYIGAAIGSFVYLLFLINAPISSLYNALANPLNGISKLVLFDFSIDFSKPFSFWAIICGMFLLSTASFGLDQDISQRLLAAKDAKSGVKSLLMAAFWTLPIVALFIIIGQLLYIYYQRPDIGGQVGNLRTYLEHPDKINGQNVTVFMHFIMTKIPNGLRALATIGVLSAAISTVNSGLNSMSSVLIQDFYKPLLLKTKTTISPSHFVNAARFGMAIVGVFLFLMALLSYHWQNSQDIPILAFVLGVMTFAYAGLIGVYACAIFTKRGSDFSVIGALLLGFFCVLFMQPYFAKLFNYPKFMQTLAFGWQLCIASIFSFLICLMGKQRRDNLSS
jgi:solute:Na+ symporter, SSS family